jgi:hypothetical protein
MHQYAAYGVGFRPTFETCVQDAEALDRSAVVDELGGVMQNQNRTMDGCRSVASGLKVPCQDSSLSDSSVCEESVGRLRVGPILTSQRNRVSEPILELLHKFLKSAAQSRILEVSPINIFW